MHAYRDNGITRTGHDAVRTAQAGGAYRSSHRQKAVRSDPASQGKTLAGTMYNMVGFQTNLAFPEQKRVVFHDTGTA
jgi:hypothetical protein